MNILSYNIKGCGSFSKKKRLAQLVRRKDFDVCFIQKTKLKEVDENLVVAL